MRWCSPCRPGSPARSVAGHHRARRFRVDPQRAFQDRRAHRTSDIDEAGFVGLINGTAEWVFIKPDHISVTVSAANKLIDRPADDLADAVWRDVAKALDLEGSAATDMPPFRVIKERRATIVANVVQEERRPGAQTDIENLALGGRLDGYAAARDDRGRGPFGRHRGEFDSASAESTDGRS